MSGRRRHMGTREDPEPSKCIGVFGLSLYTTKSELTKIFERFGPLERVQVVVDAKTGRSRGFAFIYFSNLKDATAAKEECAGMDIDHRKIRVDYSITERPHTPTPGIYMGRPTAPDRYGEHRGYGGDRYERYGRGGGGGGGYRGERYRSPSPRHRSSRRRDRGDYYGDRGYDNYEPRYERQERDRGYEREYRGYDRGYDRGYERSGPSGYDRSRSRSPIRERYRY